MTRNKLWPGVVLLLALAVFPARGGAFVLVEAPLGTWKVVQHKFSSKSEWGKKYADAYIGQEAVVSESGVTFAGETCQTAFSRSPASSQTYFKSRHGFAPQALDIRTGIVDVVTTTCSIAGFDTLVVEYDSYMYIEIQDVFFTLERQAGQ